MSLYSIALVISQLSLIILIMWNGKLVHWDIPSLSIQFLGIFVALWGVFSIRIGNFNIQPEVKAETLVTKGIFSVLRNPMYTGIILLFLPTILKAHSALMWIYYTLLVTVLILKIYREEIFLQEKFGEVYSLYKARTWRILPYIF